MIAPEGSHLKAEVTVGSLVHMYPRASWAETAGARSANERRTSTLVEWSFIDDRLWADDIKIGDHVSRHDEQVLGRLVAASEQLVSIDDLSPGLPGSLPLTDIQRPFQRQVWTKDITRLRRALKRLGIYDWVIPRMRNESYRLTRVDMYEGYREAIRSHLGDLIVNIQASPLPTEQKHLAVRLTYELESALLDLPAMDEPDLEKYQAVFQAFEQINKSAPDEVRDMLVKLLSNSTFAAAIGAGFGALFTKLLS